MSAALLDQLLAGFATPAERVNADVRPAKAANPANSRADVGLAPAPAIREGPRIAAKTQPPEPDARPHSQAFAALRSGQTAPQSSHTCGSSQNSHDSQGCPASEAIAGTWTDADIVRFLERRARLLRWGWGEPEAEALAERLVERDRGWWDDRVSCTDCKHYRPGRCGNHGRAGLAVADVGRDVATMFQRCPGFETLR